MSFVCNTNPAHNSGHGGVGIPVQSHCWFFCTHFPGCRVSKRAVLMFVKESLSWLIKWHNWLASHGGMESVDVTVSDQLRLLRTTALIGIRCCHLIENPKKQSRVKMSKVDTSGKVCSVEYIGNLVPCLHQGVKIIKCQNDCKLVTSVYVWQV